MNSLSDTTLVLIDKFHSGRASAEEISLLNSWKNNSSNNLKNYNELIEILELVKTFGDWKQFDKNKAWKRFQSKMTLRSLKAGWKFYSVAAIFLLVLAATFYNFGAISHTSGSEFLNGSNERFSVLTDGTELFLGQNSLIYTADFSDDARNLKAEGDYFINVKHDQAHPFTIDMEQISIKVLGTSFKVEESAGETKVKVRDGKVLITKKDGSVFTVTDNEVFTLNEGMAKVSKLANENWGLYENEFKDESIYNVIKDLSRQFGNLQIDSKAIDPACRITTKIEQSTIIEVLKEIELIFDIDYTIKDGAIIVRSVSC